MRWALSLCLVFLFSVGAGLAAVGDIVAVRVNSDGWSAYIDIEGFQPKGAKNVGLGPKNVPNNPTIVFSVPSLGFDASGNVVTTVRQILGTQVVRLPYPDNLTLDEKVIDGKLRLRVALSDFVYVKEKAGGVGTVGAPVTVNIAPGFYVDNAVGASGVSSKGLTNFTVTNDSLVNYPKVIGRWAWPGYSRVTGDFLVEAVAFNRFARNARPVARVVFTATDEHNHSVSVAVNEMSVSSRQGDANPVLVYAAQIPVASLTQGDQLTVNFKAYPWIGDSGSVVDSEVGADGFAQPDERLGPLYFVNDKSGAFGIGYAFVSTSGNDATGLVYSSQAAAEAGSVFRTVEKAAEAIKNYHNANHSRNDAGGGVILLASGTHNLPGTATIDLGAMKTWLSVRPASTATKETVIVGNWSGSSMKAALLKLEGLSIAASSTVLSGRLASDVLWLDRTSINVSGSTSFGYFKNGYATQNQVVNLPQGFSAFAGTTPFAFVRGNSAEKPTNSSFYSVLGNKNFTGIGFADPGSNLGQVSDNSIFAFNKVLSMIVPMRIASTATIVSGIAVVQNVVEGLTSTQPDWEISSGGGGSADTNNILIWHNTTAGQREITGYNSEGDKPFLRMNWSEKFNIYERLGKKTDTFGGGSGPNGNRVGNWPIIYNVGSIGNVIVENAFPADFNGLYSIAGPNTCCAFRPEYTDDRSYASGLGPATGNGTYTLKSTSPAIDIANTPASEQILPFDLLGKPRVGSSDAGAYERQTDDVDPKANPSKPGQLTVAME